MRFVKFENTVYSTFVKQNHKDHKDHKLIINCRLSKNNMFRIIKIICVNCNYSIVVHISNSNHYVSSVVGMINLKINKYWNRPINNYDIINELINYMMPELTCDEIIIKSLIE
jgi:hypothetical protein